jgi:hypothetical protein
LIVVYRQTGIKKEAFLLFIKIFSNKIVSLLKRKEYSIQFDNTFQMNSHLDILKKLGQTYRQENQTNENLEQVKKKAASILPKVFEPYVKRMYK